jgi:hypothetical protein
LIERVETGSIATNGEPMSNEQQSGGAMNDGSSAAGRLARYWTELPHDWQAVVLGALVLVIVATGVQIPW